MLHLRRRACWGDDIWCRYYVNEVAERAASPLALETSFAFGHSPCDRQFVYCSDCGVGTRGAGLCIGTGPLCVKSFPGKGLTVDEPVDVPKCS